MNRINYPTEMSNILETDRRFKTTKYWRIFRGCFFIFLFTNHFFISM